MKKALLLLVIASVGSAAAGAADPMFNGRQSQMSIATGVGTGKSGLIVPPWDFVPYFTTMAAYSQPNTVFRLPGRQNASLSKNIGKGESKGWDWSLLDEYIFLLSEDAFLYNTENWYYGVGMGAGMQLDYNDRIGSLLLFQFKLFVGRRITDRTNVELFYQHFSNGHITDNNHSYNFYGLSTVFKF
jgi:hypothetical protein